MLGGPGRDEPQHLVAGLIRIINDFTMMASNDAPFVGAGRKGAVLNQVRRRCAGSFDDADIVEPHLACTEQTDDKLMPLSIGSHGTGRRDTAIRVSAPARAAPLVARSPGLCRRIVGAW